MMGRGGRTREWVAGMALLGGLLLTAELAEAQSAGAPPGHSCDACHISHLDSGMGGGNAELAVVLSTLDLGFRAPEGERSCLACHRSAEDRAAVGRLLSPDEVLPLDGRYVGQPQLTDHPLGRPMMVSNPRSLTGSGGTDIDVWSARPRKSDPVSNISCSSCHDPHAAWGEDPVLTEGDRVCEGCHPAVVYEAPEHLSVGCAGCHVMHGDGSPRSSLAVASDEMCASCHLTPSRLVEDRDEALMAPPGHLQEQPGRCVDCHAPHGGDRWMNE